MLSYFISAKIGNAYLDMHINEETTYEYMWSHALISNKVYDEIKKKCNFSASDSNCAIATSKAITGNIDPYNIYAPICAGHGKTSHAGVRNQAYQFSNDGCLIYRVLSSNKPCSCLYRCLILIHALKAMWEIISMM
jgi:Serine carboxypeptidase